MSSTSRASRCDRVHLRTTNPETHRFRLKRRLCSDKKFPFAFSIWLVTVSISTILFVMRAASAFVPPGGSGRVTWKRGTCCRHQLNMMLKAVGAKRPSAFYRANMVAAHGLREFRLLSHRLLSTSKSQYYCFPAQQPSVSTSEVTAQPPEYFDLIFDLQLPEGRCIGMKLKDDLPLRDDLTHQSVQERQPPANHRTNNNPLVTASTSSQADYHWIYEKLHPEEIKFGLSLSAQARSFWMGRLALRYALTTMLDVKNNHDMTTLLPAILKDSYGRPQVPSGFLGSISHKASAGVALVAQSSSSSMEEDDNRSSRSSIGVDLETAEPRKVDIASKVLTPQEIEKLGQIPGLSREEEVLLRFSLKESLYKALHPLICQFVGFQEAQVEPAPDGTARVVLQLTSHAHEQVENVTAHWQRVGPYFLCTSSMCLKPGSKRREK